MCQVAVFVENTFDSVVEALVSAFSPFEFAFYLSTDTDVLIGFAHWLVLT